MSVNSLLNAEQVKIVSIKDEPSIEDFFVEREPDIKTGLACFDERTDGLEKGDLFMISAPTGAGKTTIMVALMMGAARLNPTKKFAYIATEEDAVQIKSRFLSYYTSSLHWKAISKNQHTRDYREELIEANNKLDNIKFIHFSTIQFNLMESLKQLVDEGVEYIFYDYLGALSDASDNKEWQTLITQADTLKSFARENQVFIMTASQCNRKAFEIDEIPEMFNSSFLAKSSGIAQKADQAFILFKFRPQDGAPLQNQDESRCYLDLYKSRYSSNNEPRMDIIIDYAHNRVREGE